MQFILFTLLNIKARFEDLKQKERGASAVEYGLLVALIAAVIIVVVTTLGTNIRDAFCDVVGATGGGACT
jgi:pilus assembly protein Flp/PilA